MLEKVNLEKTVASVTKEEYKQAASKQNMEVSVLQQKVKECKLPVVILFEGWGAAGKGSLIANLIKNFDPRGFQVFSTVLPNEVEKREPLLWRYWKKIPAEGQIAVFDRSWYQDISIARVEEDISNKENLCRMNSINTFERQLTDDGYLIIKFFLHISQKEQKRRFEKLADSKNTEWRVTNQDSKQNRQYDRYYKAFDEMLTYTDTPNAPWHVVSGHDKHAARLEIYQVVTAAITAALSKTEAKPQTKKLKSSKSKITASQIILPHQFPLVTMPKLKDIMLDKTLPREQYEKELEKQQAVLSHLHNKLYRKKVPVIVVYEGWDAAGKGGTIKRVSSALDPRGYEVVPISAPDRTEAAHHYLWRFWNRIPKDGHIAMFDRSWYGRVMVERIEGFCKESDWQRAYQEINEFEQELYDWGAVIVKFWLHIDQDEQLRRFNDRQNTPEKQWKITDEDWRNREKWDQYEVAVDEMIQKTSTKFAPWNIIESQNKEYGRIQALKALIAAIEDRI